MNGSVNRGIDFMGRTPAGSMCWDELEAARAATAAAMVYRESRAVPPELVQDGTSPAYYALLDQVEYTPTGTFLGGVEGQTAA